MQSGAIETLLGSDTLEKRLEGALKALRSHAVSSVTNPRINGEQSSLN
jgi:hypothetical protein